MNKKARFFLISTLLLSLVIIQVACNPSPPSSSIGFTPTPAITPTLSPSIIANIDSALHNAIQGSIVYNTPDALQFDQTVDILLSISPSTSTGDLQKLIQQQNQSLKGELVITPLMKAELRSEDAQAFTIQAFHDTPEQVIIAGEPTEWRWSITAKRPGDQVLTLTVYRQVEYNDQMYWRMIQNYQNSIHVTITAQQRLLNFDWKWLAGILLTALLIPAIWRLVDRGKKKKKTVQRRKSK